MVQSNETLEGSWSQDRSVTITGQLDEHWLYVNRIFVNFFNNYTTANISSTTWNIWNQYTVLKQCWRKKDCSILLQYKINKGTNTFFSQSICRKPFVVIVCACPSGASLLQSSGIMSNFAICRQRWQDTKACVCHK